MTRASRLVTLAALLGGCAYWSQEVVVLRHSGSVQLRCGDAEIASLAEQMRLKLDCDVSTATASTLALRLKDSSVVEFRPATSLRLLDSPFWRKGAPVVLEVREGEIAVVAATPILDVRTPTVAVGIRGTEFGVVYDPRSERTAVSVAKGHVQVAPVNAALAPVELRDGQRVEVTAESISPVTDIATGVWQTEWGDMALTGGSGSYPYFGGRIYGELSGNKLVGYWTQTGGGQTCAGPRFDSIYWGKIEFTFDAAGDFSGRWSWCDDEMRGGWTGRRKR